MSEQRALEELTVDECLELLGTQRLGRLAFLREDRLEILPFNYEFSNGAVFFRTGWGAFVEGIHRQHVAFEVDAANVERRSGWSVVLHGVAEEVWHEDELAQARSLPLEPWAPGDRDHYVRISPNSISGRRIV